VDIIKIYTQAKNIIIENPSITLPPIAVAILSGIFSYFMKGIRPSLFFLNPAHLGAFFGAVFLFSIAIGILGLIASGVTITMCYDVLSNGKTSLGRGFEKVMEKLLDIVVAAILMGIIVVVGFILFIIPGLLAMLFLMFTLVIVIVDDASASDAIRKSYMKVKENIGNVLIFIIVAFIVFLIVGIIGKIIEKIPLIGMILLSPIISGATTAYLNAALTIFYLHLRVWANVDHENKRCIIHTNPDCYYVAEHVEEGEWLSFSTLTDAENYCRIEFPEYSIERHC